MFFREKFFESKLGLVIVKRTPKTLRKFHTNESSDMDRVSAIVLKAVALN